MSRQSAPGPSPATSRSLSSASSSPGCGSPRGPTGRGWSRATPAPSTKRGSTCRRGRGSSSGCSGTSSTWPPRPARGPVRPGGPGPPPVGRPPRPDRAGPRAAVHDRGVFPGRDPVPVRLPRRLHPDPLRPRRAGQPPPGPAPPRGRGRVRVRPRRRDPRPVRVRGPAVAVGPAGPVLRARPARWPAAGHAGAAGVRAGRSPRPGVPAGGRPGGRRRPDQSGSSTGVRHGPSSVPPSGPGDNPGRETMTAASRERPCAVCGGDHKCSAGDGGLILCGRRDGPVPGFRHLGPSAGDPQFHLYRAGDTGERPRAAPRVRGATGPPCPAGSPAGSRRPPGRNWRFGNAAPDAALTCTACSGTTGRSASPCGRAGTRPATTSRSPPTPPGGCAASGRRPRPSGPLRPGSFDLAAVIPVVTLAGEHAKNGRAAVQPLPPHLADRLREYLADRPIDSPVWAGTWAEKAADLIRVDQDAAGVPSVVDGPDGRRYADFHSLRHTLVARLDRSGATLKEAMQLARHSDPKLTMAVYGRAQLHDLGAAVGRLPDPCDSSRPGVRPAAGTEAACTPACTELVQAGDGRGAERTGVEGPSATLLEPLRARAVLTRGLVCCAEQKTNPRVNTARHSQPRPRVGPEKDPPWLNTPGALALPGYLGCTSRRRPGRPRGRRRSTGRPGSGR